MNITNEDNMELMARYPDNYFDLAIVDPPYGIDRNGMNMGNSIFNKDDKKWDKNTPTKEYFNELFRVSKNQIIWGGNYFELHPSQYFAIWDKGETMYGRDFAECEYAWVSSGGTRIYKKSPNQLTRIHPTQKPIALYKWLLNNYAKIKCDHKHEEHYRYLCSDCKNSNVKILDTHLGSGSIAIACHDLEYDLTACELDTEYYNAAMKRINNHKKQLKLL